MHMFMMMTVVILQMWFLWKVFEDGGDINKVCDDVW